MNEQTVMDVMDSTGKSIKIGDKVRWRGEVYVINGFLPGMGRSGITAIVFDHAPHIAETPDEWSVDLISRE